jgi:hypothetical protein
MNSCSNIPVELILATTDPKLYDAKNNKWLWDGQMYWAVECLPHRQNTVSDRSTPNIDPNKYLKLSSSPTNWDYCNSKQCGSNSDSMQIVFTFNPHSTDPNDFLQYVIDIHCQVTDSPRHIIKDAKGNKLFLDIVEISKMNKIPYVEIWIARSNDYKDLTVVLEAAEMKHVRTVESDNTWLFVGILLAILVIALTVGGVLFFRHNKTAVHKPESINIG